MGPYDWHFDYDHDGKLNAEEDYQRRDYEDWVNKKGIYEENPDWDEDNEDDDF